MKNAINWFEIPVADFERAKKFYETILNFQMVVLNLGENFKMGMLPSDEEGVGGSIEQIEVIGGVFDVFVYQHRTVGHGDQVQRVRLRDRSVVTGHGTGLQVDHV